MFICAGILSVIAVLIIAVSSPLFAVLGFEYSTLMALALSVVCGIAAAMRQRIEVALWTEIRQIIFKCLLLSSIPLVISIISLLFISNCSFSDGLIFYLEIAYPSAIFGGLFGLAFSWLVKKRSKAILFFIAFWVVTLFLSFLPGYFNPQLYTYGWQYGFFPGIVWDESLELTNTYLAFRIENIIWVIFALSLTYEMRLPRVPKMWFVIPVVIALTLFGFQDELHITTSHDAVNSSLTKILQPIPNCSIYYAPGSLTQDEIDKINRDVRWYLHDIEMRFFLHPPSEPISIYIYPSSDVMFSLIGTRTASISKPWLGELHIAKENLESLKHELTHVLLRQKGVFPFYVSWSTGLTEGAAMSVEPEYDGLYTLDEHAARILQMHYANGVKQVMSFTGFASNASQKSYVLAGSFSRYLLSTYGSLPFNNVYASLDWQHAYGKPLDSLEAEWKRWLAPMMTPMDAEETAHFRFYYDRPSIIFNPCLRRIGKLTRMGNDAYRESRFSDAEGFYRDAIKEGGGIGSLRSEANALLRQNKLMAAITVLDTTRPPSIRPQAAALRIDLANLEVIAPDSGRIESNAAWANYWDAQWEMLSSASYLAATSDFDLYTIPFPNSDFEAAWLGYVRSVYLPSSSKENSFERLDELYFWAKSQNDYQSRFVNWIDVDLRYLHAQALEQKGFLDSAAKDDPFQNGLPDPHYLRLHPEELSWRDSLPITLIARHFLKLRPGPTGIDFCPLKYRRAAKEIADELNAEWKYLRSNPAAPGHGTYP